MRQSLPPNPSLEAIEKKASRLLRDVRRGNAAAVARWHSLDSEAGTGHPRPADIQYLIAREYGFRSWQSLKDGLEKDNRSAPEDKARIQPKTAYSDRVDLSHE